MTAPSTLLVVDDAPTNLSVVVPPLRQQAYRVLTAQDGRTALSRAEQAQPDLILLDIMMPGLDGFEVCRQLKNNPKTADIPVIFMTALTDPNQKVNGFQTGAVDYITKPVQHEELLARVKLHLRLSQLNRQLKDVNKDLTHTVDERTSELQFAYEKLQKMDRHKTDFIDIVAHELRTPLTAIKLVLQMVQMQVREDVDLHSMEQSIGQALGAAERMHIIVNDMLDVVHIDNETLSTYQVETVIWDVVYGIQHQFRNAVTDRDITLQYDHNDPHVLAELDPDLFKKTVRHLLMNAIKYTPDGGKVTLNWGFRDNDFFFSVEDNGIGIDPENLSLVFEKFYQTGPVQFHSSGQTKFKGGGPGLGLAIVKGIVAAHNGRVWAESTAYDETECPGTTVTLTIPQQKADQKYLE